MQPQEEAPKKTTGRFGRRFGSSCGRRRGDPATAKKVGCFHKLRLAPEEFGERHRDWSLNSMYKESGALVVFTPIVILMGAVIRAEGRARRGSAPTLFMVSLAPAIVHAVLDVPLVIVLRDEDFPPDASGAVHHGPHETTAARDHLGSFEEVNRLGLGLHRIWPVFQALLASAGGTPVLLMATGGVLWNPAIARGTRMLPGIWPLYVETPVVSRRVKALRHPSIVVLEPRCHDDQPPSSIS
ncbi:MAG: hypothetical protein IRY95_09950 [Clostridia bacterium]|nr:hypothetical protein [Clostridia bacterium]